MGNIRYNEEQIIAKLRKAELLFSEGKSKGEVCISNKVMRLAPHAGATMGRGRLRSRVPRGPLP